MAEHHNTKWNQSNSNMYRFRSPSLDHKLLYCGGLFDDANNYDTILSTLYCGTTRYVDHLVFSLARTRQLCKSKYSGVVKLTRSCAGEETKATRLFSKHLGMFNMRNLKI